MKTIKIQLEYQCYPVWIYDDEGIVEDTALPQELANDHDLNEKFKSLQERFDATYVDTPTEFRYQGFASKNEESAFKKDLKAAVDNLIEKCPKCYSMEFSPNII